MNLVLVRLLRFIQSNSEGFKAALKTVTARPSSIFTGLLGIRITYEGKPCVAVGPRSAGPSEGFQTSVPLLGEPVRRHAAGKLHSTNGKSKTEPTHNVISRGATSDYFSNRRLEYRLESSSFTLVKVATKVVTVNDCFSD